MIYPSITRYKEALLAAEDNFDKLSAPRPVEGANGQPYMDSGNFAVVFKMTDGTKNYAVKCFIKDQPGRAEAYRKTSDVLRCVRSEYLVNAEYMEKELFVDMGGKGDELFPVLKMDWVEGRRLDDYLRSAGTEEKAMLADALLSYGDDIEAARRMAAGITVPEPVPSQGDAEWQNKQGEKCYYGRGVEQDYSKAVEWWRKAAAQGNEKAKENLRRLGESY